MTDLREKLRKRALQKSTIIMKKHANSEIIEQGNRPCPICGNTMSIASNNNILIDVCPEHGVWLDSGELEQIIFNVKSKDSKNFRDKIKSIKKDSLKKGKVAALTWGIWSLLDD